MSHLLLFVEGFVAALLVVFLLKNTKKWYVWLLSAGWYAWLTLGISFAALNFAGQHPKAGAVGITVFGIIAVIWAFVIVRMLGLIGKKKTPIAVQKGDAA